MLLNHGVATLADINHQTVVHIRTNIFVFGSRGGKTEQAVELRHHIGIDLHLRHKPAQRKHQLRIEPVLNDLYLLFRRQDSLLIFFEFGGDISLGTDECLLAYPVLRHYVLVVVAHLKIVAEAIVVAYLQTLDTCLLRLALLDTEQVFLSVVVYIAQRVQFAVHSVGDDVRTPLYCRRIRQNLLLDTLAHFAAEVYLLAQQMQIRVIFRPEADLANRHQCPQGCGKLHHLTRADTSCGDLAHNTFHILNLLNLLPQQIACLGVAEEILYHRLAVAYRAHIFQRECHPAM